MSYLKIKFFRTAYTPIGNCFSFNTVNIDNFVRQNEIDSHFEAKATEKKKR